MIKIFRSNERGSADHGWLQAKHSFSFSSYYDPKRMGFKSLRVINEDRVEKKRGFATHGHKDMEIITYVLEGLLEHKDSMGNGSIIQPGEVQYMSAGSGVEHSEKNPSHDQALHLLQIWILPNILSAKPRYDQKAFSKAEKLNRLCLIATSEEPGDLVHIDAKIRSKAILIRQDAHIYTCILEPGQTLNYPIIKNRGVWLQVLQGGLIANNNKLYSGDAASFESEDSVILQTETETEFLLFDLI